MATAMNSYSHAMRQIVSMSALALIVAPVPVSGATPRKATAPASAQKAPTADNSIIPLPLNPIVPTGQRLCASRTASGLGYTVLRPATGPTPAAADTVLVNYVGYLAATGAVFDQGMRSPLPVGEVIAGFSQGLQMTGRSGVVRLCIPAALGYGAQASGPIPANSDLVFQIELLDFKTPAELDAMRAAPAAEAPGPEGTPPQP
jgi:FKBP-type peptidyl-prolyl cis-trans isomerase FkpA